MSWLSKAVKKVGKAAKKAVKDVTKVASSPVGAAVLGIAGTVITGGLLGPVAATLASKAAGLAAKAGKVADTVEATIKGLPIANPALRQKLADKIMKGSNIAESMFKGVVSISDGNKPVPTIKTQSAAGGKGMLIAAAAVGIGLLVMGKRR